MQTLKNRIAEFHADESGESTAISNVAVLAVGAIVLLAILALWNDTIKEDVTNKLKQILGGGTAPAADTTTTTTT